MPTLFALPDPPPPPQAAINIRRARIVFLREAISALTSTRRVMIEHFLSMDSLLSEQ